MIRNKKRFFIFLFIVIAVVTGSWGWEQYQDVKGPGLPVLLYHSVDSHGPRNKYTLDTDVFEQQLRWLKDHGYNTILPREILKRSKRMLPDKTVMLTFDDGNLNNYSVVYPLLRKYGFSGVFFIIIVIIGHNAIINDKQLKEMSLGGMEIGSHTASHPYLDTLSLADVEDQLHRSKQRIEEITGRAVTSLAPPGGWFDAVVEKIARQQGYDFLFSCEIGLNDLVENPFVYKRNEVLRGMSLTEFQGLLEPSRVFGYRYKLTQSLKFALHWLIGTQNYVKLSHAI